MKNAVLPISWSIVMLAVISPVAFASGGSWSLDSNTSYANLFQGSAENPDSVNTGVARVTGKVKLDTNDLDNSVFDLSIYPADEDWGNALSPEGDLPTGYVPDATDHTLLTFKSKRLLRTGNGKLEVIGDLTLTRVERSIDATWSRAYSGPVYGDPVIHTATHPITFAFPDLSASLLPGPLTAARLQQKGALEVSGSARLSPATFPELLTAIKETNWPPVVWNEDCQYPSAGRTDYSGLVCTGTLIAATRAGNCYMPATVGADYNGAICTPAAGSQTTIVLDLKLVHQGSEPSAAVLAGGAQKVTQGN